MYYRPTRLALIKFLGLWGAQNQATGDKGTHDEKKLLISQSPRVNGSIEHSQSELNRDFELAKDKSSKKIARLMLKDGPPGLTISVSVSGQTVWQAAFGFCDVENLLPCEPDAHMRIASISKPLFATTVVAPLIEEGKLNIKDSIHKYLSLDEFSKQKHQDKEFDITFEQLLSHTGGIKHYGEGFKDEPLRPIGSEGSKKIHQSDDQYNREGFFQRRTYRNVIDALEPFKECPLVKEPGLDYSYSTYGYTLLSAAIQKVQQKSLNEDSKKVEQIEDFWIKTLRREWDMRETHLDQDEPIISKRSRYYLRSGANGELINAPYQDASVKWAGGGLISTTDDLLKFGNAILDCYKGRHPSKLKKETIELLWKEVKNEYALGWNKRNIKTRSNSENEQVIYHTGGALGASSVLIIYPESEVVVAILTNLYGINLAPLSMEIAEEFLNSK